MGRADNPVIEQLFDPIDGSKNVRLARRFGVYLFRRHEAVLDVDPITDVKPKSPSAFRNRTRS